MKEIDFSKCICENPGYCPIYRQVMGACPPNWKWCQNATPQRRKQHYEDRKKQQDNSQNKSYYTINPVKFNDINIIPKSKNAICVIPANDSALSQYNITKDNIIKYAQKNNADLVELFGDQSPNDPMCNKYRLSQILGIYEKTLYIDCDIFIKNNAPNIFELTPNDKISIFNEIDYFINTNNNEWITKEQGMIVEVIGHENASNHPGEFMFNGGVMVIPRFLAKYYSQPAHPYPNFWCFDQHLLSLKLPKEKLYLLNYQWNLTYTSNRYKNQFFKNIDSAYFIHLNDSELNFKVEMLKLLNYMDG